MGTLPKLPLSWSGGGHIWRRRLRGRINTKNTALVQNACTTLKSNWIKVKWEKGIMKGSTDAKTLEPKKMRVSSVGEKPSMVSG